MTSPLIHHIINQLNVILSFLSTFGYLVKPRQNHDRDRVTLVTIPYHCCLLYHPLLPVMSSSSLPSSVLSALCRAQVNVLSSQTHFSISSKLGNTNYNLFYKYFTTDHLFFNVLSYLGNFNLIVNLNSNNGFLARNSKFGILITY